MPRECGFYKRFEDMSFLMRIDACLIMISCETRTLRMTAWKEE